MSKFSKKIIIFLASFFLLSFAISASAALVPCGGENMPSCRLCHFMFLVRNITDFILKVLVPLGVVFVIIGGLLILISRNTSMATTGRKLVKSALTGIIIGLAAWLIMDTIMVFALQPGTIPFPWYIWDLQCPIVKISLPNAMTSSYTLVTDTDPTGISPGDTLQYTLTYTNISNQNLTNLNITVDYDQNQATSISNITSGGIDDGDKISWNIGNLNSGQSITLSYNFILSSDILQFLNPQTNQNKKTAQILKKFLNFIIRPASGQTSPYISVYYKNVVTISSKEAESESIIVPLQINLPNSIFANRTYYLIKDIKNDKLPNIGDGLRYDVRYFNPTALNFSNVVIISDYDQQAISINKIDGGGVDDGNKITWNLGNLLAGQPAPTSPGCIGYSFTIIGHGTMYFGQFTANMFYLTANNGILETRNDAFSSP